MRSILILFLLATFTTQVASAVWKAKVQAWLYPASVTCVAKQEYQDGRGFFSLKPEYWTIDGDGKWKWLNETASNPESCNGYSLDNVKTIKENSIEQYATVSAGLEAMKAFFASNAQKNSAITAWTNFCIQSGFTGIELDWEGYGDWTAADYTNFKNFITALGNSLHNAGKKFMINGPPISDAKSQEWYEWKYEDFINLPVDFMSVMAYDYMYDYGCGTPVQPLDWLSQIVEWTKDKYPYLDKIVIGIPSYGYSGATGSFNVGRTNKQQASRINGFTGARRDTASGESSWAAGGTSHFFVDGVGLDQKRTTIEALGIKHVSVFHLGGNDWFSGQEPEGGYVGSTTPQPTQGTTKPTQGTKPSQGTKPTEGSVPETDGSEICCRLCSEIGKPAENSARWPLFIAIAIVGTVGIVAAVLGTLLGYRAGQRKSNAGEYPPENVQISSGSPLPRSQSESFPEQTSPAPAFHRRPMFTGIVDSPDLSQLRKSSKNLNA